MSMGRKRRFPVEGGSVEPETSSNVPEKVSDAALERLGLGGRTQICSSCNARNKGRDKCRKCGHTNLREKKVMFNDNR